MSSVAERCIYPELFDRHVFRCLPFMNWQWISFSSLRRVCRLDRMSSVYMSGSLDCDSLPSLLLLPATTFDPPPSLQAEMVGRRNWLAAVRLSESQPVVETMMPADLLFNRPCPLPGSYCQVHDQRSVEALFIYFFTSISTPHCNIGRFLLQLPVRAFIQTTETVQLKYHLAAPEEVCFWLQGTKLCHLPAGFSV